MESQSLLSAAPALAGVIGQIAGEIQATLPEYRFTWTTDNASWALADMQRGSVCLLCLGGAFTQCLCMYARWQVLVKVSPSVVELRFSSAEDTMCVACFLGGLIGAALTSKEYDRMRRLANAGLRAWAAKQAAGVAVQDMSPPSYDEVVKAGPLQPPPTYSAYNNVEPK